MRPVTLEELRPRLAVRRPTRISDPGATQAAVALVLTPDQKGLSALFIRRAEFPGDPWSGHMALPGGRRHLDDPSLFDTAVRETLEETGVGLQSAHLLGELDDFTPSTPRLPAIIIRPFVFGLQTRPAVTASPEVAYHRWIGLSELRQAATIARIEIHGTPTAVPAFQLGDDVIWGLTERILRPVLQLAF